MLLWIIAAKDRSRDIIRTEHNHCSQPGPREEGARGTCSLRSFSCSVLALAELLDRGTPPPSYGTKRLQISLDLGRFVV